MNNRYINCLFLDVFAINGVLLYFELFNIFCAIESIHNFIIVADPSLRSLCEILRIDRWTRRIRCIER